MTCILHVEVWLNNISLLAFTHPPENKQIEKSTHAYIHTTCTNMRRREHDTLRTYACMFCMQLYYCVQTRQSSTELLLHTQFLLADREQQRSNRIYSKNEIRQQTPSFFLYILLVVSGVMVAYMII